MYSVHLCMYIIAVPCQVSVPRPTRVRGRPFCCNGLALPTASGGPYGGGRAPRCSRAGDRVCKRLYRGDFIGTERTATVLPVGVITCTLRYKQLYMYFIVKDRFLFSFCRSFSRPVTAAKTSEKHVIYH